MISAIGAQLINNKSAFFVIFEKIGLQSFFAGYFVYLIGMLLKDTRLLDFVKKHMLVSLVVSLGGLFLLNNNGRIELNDGHIENVVFFTLTSLMGLVLIYIISSNSNCFSDFIEYIGRHSLWILGLHFLNFKIVTLVYLKIMQDNTYTLAAYPVVYKSDMLWIAYTVVGILAPLLVKAIFQISINGLKKISFVR